MQMHLEDTEEEIIKTDSRFSNANCSSRKKYLMKSTLLEKRLALDYSLLLCKLTIHSLTNLQSCCNRQLLNIGGIIEESEGRDRKEIMLITKIMPNLKHCMCTDFGISSTYCRGEENQLAGAEQENKFF